MIFVPDGRRKGERGDFEAKEGGVVIEKEDASSEPCQQRWRRDLQSAIIIIPAVGYVPVPEIELHCGGDDEQSKNNAPIKIEPLFCINKTLRF